jgi:hypothetical protein
MDHYTQARPPLRHEGIILSMPRNVFFFQTGKVVRQARLDLRAMCERLKLSMKTVMKHLLNESIMLLPQLSAACRLLSGLRRHTISSAK